MEHTSIYANLVNRGIERGISLREREREREREIPERSPPINRYMFIPVIVQGPFSILEISIHNNRPNCGISIPSMLGVVSQATWEMESITGCLAFAQAMGKWFTCANHAQVIHFHMQLSSIETLFIVCYFHMRISIDSMFHHFSQNFHYRYYLISIPWPSKESKWLG